MKFYILGLVLAVLTLAVAWFVRIQAPSPAENAHVPVVTEPANTNAVEAPDATSEPIVNANTAPMNANVAVPKPAPPAVVYPMAGFPDRITKKHFGQYITKANSPVQPERFSGYHTGADAEVTEAEQTVDVPVYAIADGTIVVRRTASGYGGVVLVEFTVNGETVTGVYGHVRLSSVTKRVGDHVTRGERLGVLGTGFSSETDGERKHLHFGLLKGRSTNLRGYVATAAALSPWLDPVVWLADRQTGQPG